MNKKAHNQFKCLKTFKVLVQILIIILVITTLIFALLAFLNNLNMEIHRSMIYQASTSIFNQQQAFFLRKQTKTYEGLLSEAIQHLSTKLKNINRLFLKFEKQKNSHPSESEWKSPQHLLNNTNEELKSYFGIFKKKDLSSPMTNDQINSRLIVESISHLGLYFDDQAVTQIYGSFKQDPQYLIINPFPNNSHIIFIVWDDYRADIRPWYIQSLVNFNANKLDRPQLVTPYYYPDNITLSLAISMPMVDQLGNFQGAWSMDLKQGYLNSLFANHTNNQNQMILLANGSGTLYHHAFKLVKPIPLFIQNSSFTGFDEEDFLQMVKFANQSDFVSNCLTPYVNPLILCRYNTLLEIDQQIYVRYNDDLEMYIILTQKLTDIDKFINEDIPRFQNELHTEFEQQFYRIIYATFFYLLAVVFILKVILKPMTIVINHSARYNKALKDTFRSNQQSLPKIDKNIGTNNSLQQMLMAYIKLIGRITNQRKNKQEQCKDIEAFQYPRQYEKFQLSAQKTDDSFSFNGHEQTQQFVVGTSNKYAISQTEINSLNVNINLLKKQNHQLSGMSSSSIRMAMKVLKKQKFE